MYSRYVWIPDGQPTARPESGRPPRRPRIAWIAWIALTPLIPARADTAWAQDEGWNGPRSVQIAARAVEARAHAYADSSLRDFEAAVEGHVYFLGEFGDERELVRADQISIELRWQAPDRALQTIVGRRHERRFPTRIQYHIDHLSVVLDNFGDRIRLGEGDEVRNVLHPAAAGALNFYDYRLVDSLEIRIRDHTARVYRLEVRPSDADRPGVVGTLYVERGSGAIARMTVTFTGAAYRDPSLDYISLDLRSALWEGRYWLPAEQEIEIRRQLSWLSYPVGGVIRTRFRILDYRINQGPSYSLGRGDRVASLPQAMLERYSEWREPLYGEGLAASERSDEALARMRRRASALVGPADLLGTSRLQFYLPDASSALRARRAEGVLLGGGGSYRLDESSEIRVWVGYPFGMERVEIEAGAVRAFGPVELGIVGYAERLADIGPFRAASGTISSLALALSGEDYTDPYFEDGVELEIGTERIGDRTTLRFSYSNQRSAELTIRSTALDGSTPRPVRPIDEGTLAGLKLTTGYGLGSLLGARWSLDVSAEAGLDGVGDFGFTRAIVGLRAEGDRPGTPWGWGVRVAGGVSGGTLPAQRLFLLGGRGTVPGYPFRRWGGDRFGTLEADLSRALLAPWLRARLRGAAGWTTLGSAGSAAAERLGVAESGGLRLAAGGGLGFFYDIVRLDAVHGLRDGDWEVILSIKRSLWPVL